MKNRLQVCGFLVNVGLSDYRKNSEIFQKNECCIEKKRIFTSRYNNNLQNGLLLKF